MQPESPGGAVKPVTIWMRLNILCATLLCFLAGLSLFVGTDHTDQFSAWTINSAVTAAFLGAAYWGAGVVLTLLSARERAWANARVSIPATYTFSALGLISTTIHLDRFHLTTGSLLTQILTWLWLVPYALGTVLAIVILVHQVRQPGGDPPRVGTLPEWLR